MDFGGYTIHSSSAIKRFSHRSRLNRAVRLLCPTDGDRIVDYGTGDGVLLVFLNRFEPRARLCGFETAHREEAERNTRSLEAVAGIYDSVDRVAAFRPNKIACLEVLEHLRPDVQASILADFRRLVGGDGRILISVPIEIGPPSLFKNVIRWAVDQPHRGMNPRNVFLSLLGMTSRIKRGDDVDYIASHIGFDYRTLARLIRDSGFRIRRSYSPFSLLGPWFNTQVFFVLQAVRGAHRDDLSASSRPAGARRNDRACRSRG